MRSRKALAAAAFLVFLVFWIWAAATLADALPDLWWVKALYFAVAGIGWGVPLLPLMAWAEKDPNHQRRE